MKRMKLITIWLLCFVFIGSVFGTVINEVLAEGNSENFSWDDEYDEQTFSTLNEKTHRGEVARDENGNIKSPQITVFTYGCGGDISHWSNNQAENLNGAYKFEFEEDVYVYSEQSKLETILYNFLSNAINYCGDDKLVIVKQTTENEYVKISFIDHGIGIAKEHINDIWNRYYKIDKNHDRKHEGTGIGLAIVKSVLERYGAEYGVESEEGKGSEFWFKLKMIDKNNKMEKKRHEK
jgi:signal transduction histidine kinase